MKSNRVWLLVIIIIIIVFGGTAIVTYMYNLNYPEMIATAGLLFAASAFIGVFFTLNATYLQLRKVMAKPKLKLALTEEGKIEKSFTISRREDVYGKNLDFWIFNNGNAITKLFQIDLEIPCLYSPRVPIEADRKIKYIQSKITENKTEILSLCNNEDVICFVNNPVRITDVKLCFDHRNYDISNDFIIHYKIFGDWAETQEGTLKIIIEKSKENPNVLT